MKNLITIGALLFCASLLTAQEKAKQVTVRIKKVETINGVTSIKDTSYTTSEAEAIKAGGHNISVIESDADGKATKTVIMDGQVVSSDGSEIKILEGKDLDTEIEMALTEAGVEIKDGNGVKKIVIVNSDCKKDGDGKSEKKVTKVVIINKAKITEPSAEDSKLLGKSTGISDNKLAVDKLDFYPNPSSGKFNLKFNLREKGDTEINIMNMEGKKIYSEKLKGFTGTYDKEIDISNNPKGIYFVRIQQGEHAQLKKIVLE